MIAVRSFKSTHGAGGRGGSAFLLLRWGVLVHITELLKPYLVACVAMEISVSEWVAAQSQTIKDTS